VGETFETTDLEGSCMLPWIALSAFVVLALALDLRGGGHATPSLRAALLWSVAWTAAGFAFAIPLAIGGGGAAAGEYLAGFLIEKSLSLDNLFVFAVLLSFFAVPAEQRRLVLLCGIGLAIVLRAVFIVAGAAALDTFDAATYALGALLAFTAFKIARQGSEEIDPESTLAMRLLRRVIPISGEYDGSRLTTVTGGRRLATPLLAALAMVAAFDLMFAIDSIPAIFAITRDTFVVFAANAFSLLGMVSLYFVLEELLKRFRHLNLALAAILGYVAAKMLLADIWHPPLALSLAVIVGALGLAILTSALAERREKLSRAHRGVASSRGANAGPRDSRRGTRQHTTYIPLLWRVFALNAAVLGVAVALTVIVLPPHVLAAGAAEEELAILIASLALMLAINLLLLRHAFAPLAHLTQVMRKVDLLRPGQRVPVEGSASEVVELADSFNEMLARLEAERQESTSRALAAQEGERLRVAQELHDEIGQSLTAVLLELARAERQAPDALSPQLREMQESVRASLNDARRIALELRPEALDDLGLAAALLVLADRLGERAGIDIEHHVERPLPVLAYEQELVLYRVAQEALTNVVRHASAKRAELSLRRNNGQLELRVRDDGRGLGGAPAAGGGIRGMRERALMVRAELNISERPGGGLEMALDLPIGGLS
jgi:two-component system, NarL family, sensor histidine kinase UhpB